LQSKAAPHEERARLRSWLRNRSKTTTPAWSVLLDGQEVGQILAERGIRDPGAARFAHFSADLDRQALRRGADVRRDK